MRQSHYKDMLRIKTYMEKHYWEDIGVEDIAKHIGYTPRHCNILFKACCGETLGTYLTTLRMNEAKRLLDTGISVGSVAKSLSYKPRGFFKAFRDFYGVSPSEYVKTGKTLEQYVKTYEWKCTEENWGKGENPTPDGLWEFAYYNPQTNEYGLMEWFEKYQHFRAPLTASDWRVDPNWYCRNRAKGDGMHPGRVTQAVRTFLCPHSGTLEMFLSFGRAIAATSNRTPCLVQLFHNDRPLNDAVVMDTADPVQFRVCCTVRAGDRIRFHIDPMGNHIGDGVWFYRQVFGYKTILEENPE